MGRSSTPVRAIKTEPYVSAMMQANALKVEGGKAVRDGLTAFGAGIGGGLIKMGERREHQKDRALQKEMQAKNQRLGWARLQFEKQSVLLNELDDDLKLAQSRVDESAALAGVGAGDPEAHQKAQQAFAAAQSRREAVRNAVFSTARQSGTEMGAGFEYDPGTGAGSFPVDDCFT